MAISKIIGSGLGTINSPVEFTSADNLTQITLSSTDADANSGPNLDFYRNSGSPADNDLLAKIRIQGKNDAGQQVLYSFIDTYALDVTDGTEDGGFYIYRMMGGSSVESLSFTATEAVFNESSKDYDFRVESNNDANAFVVEGSTGNIGIGIAAPAGDFHLTDAADIRMLFTSDQTGNTAGDGTFIGLTDGGHFSIFNREATSTRLLTSGVVGLQVSSIGAVTKPLQPAFQANIDNTQANINGTVKINFATQVFDQGNNFQPGTGDGQGGDTSNKTATFAAPATGKYQLNVSIRLENIDSAAGYYQVSIITSNRNYRYIFDPDFGQDNAFFTPSISILADMDTSDTAFVQIQQSGGSAQTDMHPETYFSGYLVC